jgi:hypothetical protein
VRLSLVFAAYFLMLLSRTDASAEIISCPIGKGPQFRDCRVLLDPHGNEVSQPQQCDRSSCLAKIVRIDPQRGKVCRFECFQKFVPF